MLRFSYRSDSPLMLMACDSKQWMKGKLAFVKVEDETRRESVDRDRSPDSMPEGD
jgi:hypothetical protein